MNRLFVILLILFSVACTQQPSPEDDGQNGTQEPIKVVTDAYELSIPKQQGALLILFPCFPCDAANTKAEFNIEKLALKNGIAVLYMNFNQHLWLSEGEKVALEGVIEAAIRDHKLNSENTFIGGFSSGGNTSLLLANYLKQSKSSIQPKGLFIVDSPIDLYGLNENARRTIAKNYSKIAVEEANWIVETFEAEFGSGDSSMGQYENKSPYLFKTHSISNLSSLNEVKMRFYSEPDTNWWWENRQTKYEEMNSYYIEQLTTDYNKVFGEGSIVHIESQNRGYRANGERHPHSWSLVDPMDLVHWILESI